MPRAVGFDCSCRFRAREGERNRRACNGATLLVSNIAVDRRGASLRNCRVATTQAHHQQCDRKAKEAFSMPLHELLLFRTRLRCGFWLTLLRIGHTRLWLNPAVGESSRRATSRTPLLAHRSQLFYWGFRTD